MQRFSLLACLLAASLVGHSPTSAQDAGVQRPRPITLTNPLRLPYRSLQRTDIDDRGPERLSRLRSDAASDDLLDDKYAPIRESAATALLAQLSDGLGADDAAVRDSTLKALAALGPRAEAAVPKLLESLATTSAPSQRANMIRTLGMIRSESPEVVQVLTAILEKPAHNDAVRASAIWALGNIGKSASAATLPLSRILQDRQQAAELRAEAAIALNRIRPETAANMLPFLRDGEAAVRVAAARALAGHSATRGDAIPVLIDHLHKPVVGSQAAEALAVIGRPAVPALAKRLGDERADRKLRIAVADVLGRIGQDGSQALIDAVCGDDRLVADAAARALLSVGPDAIPLLVRRHQAMAIPDAAEPRDAQQARIVRRLETLIEDLSGPLAGPAAAPPAMMRMAPMMIDVPPMDDSQPGHRSRRDPSGAEPFEATAEPFGPVDGAMPTAPESSFPEESAEASEFAEAPLAIDTAAGQVVKVFYGTNRNVLAVGGSADAPWRVFLPALIVGGITLTLCVVGFALSRSLIRATVCSMGLVIALLLGLSAMRQTTAPQSSVAARPGPTYGSDSASSVDLGVCEVTIPESHQYGEVESPSILKLEFSADPQKHIVLRKVERLERERFYDRLHGEMADKGSELFVFVHGFNVGFDDAARRTAQMAHDLEFAGAPVFFSWPSQGNWYQYRQDETQVELAVEPLKRFLRDLVDSSEATSIHLIAHSMGNRALTAALREIETTSQERSTPFNQVVLAAPDINADIFRTRIAPAIVGKAERVTLYASSNDLALVASRSFNGGGSRAGDTSHGIVPLPGVETIDVSRLDTSLLGHSYYGSNPSVLTDLKKLLRDRRSASERPSLVPVTVDDLCYWVFEHEQTARRPSTVR